MIKYRFKDLPFIVADGKGTFYQLPHSTNNYYKSFRKLNVVLNNGVTEGYRINRKFVSVIQLRKLAYEAHEILNLDDPNVKLPF